MQKATDLDALVLQMSSRNTNKKSVSIVKTVGEVNNELLKQQEEKSMVIFRSWIHNPVEPEKRMEKFKVAERLGDRALNIKSDIVKISNVFPVDVAEGLLCFMKRINDWSTSNASNDKEGNKSSYGAGTTEHQFSASACLNNSYRKDFDRLYEVIASLLPSKAHHAFQAGRYTEGHFIDAHDDAAYIDVDMRGKNGNSLTSNINPESNKKVLCSRDIAMVYYLTKNWTSDNGGCFIDLVGGKAITPEWNSVVLFHVPRLHRVEPVLTDSIRYSIFGWFFEKGRLYDLSGKDKSEKKKSTDISNIASNSGDCNNSSNKKKRKKKNAKVIQISKKQRSND